jgi:hypothetical protein
MNREPDRDSESAEPSAADEPPGRVEFDSRGNSVWRWARGVLDSTSVLLKRLENKDLALEPTQKVPVMKGSDVARNCAKRLAARGREDDQPAPRHPALPPLRRDRGGGFDPYNTR